MAYEALSSCCLCRPTYRMKGTRICIKYKVECVHSINPL